MLKNDGVKYARIKQEALYILCDEKLSITIHDVMNMSSDDGDHHALVHELFLPLLSSDSFSDMIETLNKDWIFVFDQINAGGYALDLETKSICIDNAGLMPDALSQSNYFKQCIRQNILRAVRDIWHAQKFQKKYDRLSPDSYIKSERVRSADVECFALLCAYEMSLSDESIRLWQHFLSSETGDLAIQFQRFLERGSFTHNMLDLALQQSFKQWFKDLGRLNSCDHRTLEDMDDMMQWDEHEMQKRKQKLSVQDITEMTSRADNHGSYLGDLSLRILRHPEFSKMEDVVNQTHLMHIMRDLKTVSKGNVQFRTESLAEKIFPTMPVFVEETL